MIAKQEHIRINCSLTWFSLWNENSSLRDKSTKTCAVDDNGEYRNKNKEKQRSISNSFFKRFKKNFNQQKISGNEIKVSWNENSYEFNA